MDPTQDPNKPADTGTGGMPTTSDDTQSTPPVVDAPPATPVDGTPAAPGAPTTPVEPVTPTEEEKPTGDSGMGGGTPPAA